MTTTPRTADWLSRLCSALADFAAKHANVHADLATFGGADCGALVDRRFAIDALAIFDRFNISPTAAEREILARGVTARWLAFSPVIEVLTQAEAEADRRAEASRAASVRSARAARRSCDAAHGDDIESLIDGGANVCDACRSFGAATH
jgi:hypothetical protein